jgi:peptide/nickel transport system permease protein
MLNFMLHRTVQSLPILLLVSVLVFGALHIVPGDPILARQGQSTRLTEEELDQLRAQVGLDKPLYEQYVRWVVDALRGDLGLSYNNQRPVSELVRLRFPATFELAILSLTIAMLIAIPVGILSAVRRNSLLDYFSTGFVTVGIALPGFWLGIMMILLFSVRLDWLPAVGYVPFREDPIQNLKHAAMPSLTLGFLLAAPTMRFLRSSMLEVIRQDYVQTARAKGLAERAVITGHAMKNALIPTITIVGLQLGHLLGGAVIIEWVYGWPGLGELTVDAIKMRDYSVVQATVFLFAAGFVVVNLLVDLLYGALDPRIRHATA